jgi:hypothetical protein
MAVSLVAAVALALAAPAWATTSATVTPLGPGALFLTLTNPGPETITGYLSTPPGEQYAINIATGQACQFVPFFVSLRACEVTVAPATSAQICFAGSAPELYPGLGMLIRPAGGLPYRITVSTSAVAPPCPFPPGVAPGNTSGTSGTPGSGSGSGGGSSATPVTPTTGTHPKGAHSWSRARCKSTYKAWAKKHRRATRRQKKAEASKLHKAHGCPLSVLK